MDNEQQRAAGTPAPTCSAWMEVSESEFFRAIGPRDVHPSIQPGQYPYTTIWQTPDRIALGKSVGRLDGGLEITAWYLPNAAAHLRAAKENANE